MKLRNESQYFLNLATDEVLNQNHPKLLCGRSTFNRRYDLFQTTSELPRIDDYVIKLGAPPIFPNDGLQKLNVNLKNAIEFGEKNKQIGDHISVAVEKYRSEREVHANQKISCAYTIEFYQRLITNGEPYVHMIKYEDLT